MKAGTISSILARVAFWFMLTLPGRVILAGINTWTSITRPKRTTP